MKFLETCGKVYINQNDKYADISTMWVLANNDMSMCEPILKVWHMKKKYNCIYTDDIEDTLKKLEVNTYCKPIN